MVRAMTTQGDQLVAVGVAYEHHLPLFGPGVPHEGRVWLSADGRQWEDVTPPETFGNVYLHTLIRRADGTLVAFGYTSRFNRYAELVTDGVGTWESADGRSWTQTDSGLPPDRWIVGAVQGKKGILADAYQVGDNGGSKRWFSADGRSWELQSEIPHGRYSVDAGDEGFVLAGTRGPYEDPGSPFAMASADGRKWIESADPPADIGDVVAIGGDWLAVSVPLDFVSNTSSFATWESTNGLDWSPGEDIGLDDSGPQSDAGCVLFPTLVSAGRYVIARTTWSGLCSEGGYTAYGPHELSIDGHDWHELQLMRDTNLEPGQPGAWVASAEFNGLLVLAGESNRRAAFWFGE